MSENLVVEVIFGIFGLTVIVIYIFVTIGDQSLRKSKKYKKPPP
jgi:hypothetical protein